MAGVDCRADPRSAFKAYDVRGSVPGVLTWELACALGTACVEAFAVRRAVVGRDVRLSGPMLLDGLCLGLTAGGAFVTDIGMCGTEEIYHAAAFGDFDVGIMITGSHNPAQDNGFKVVRRGAVPVSGDSGLGAMGIRVAELLEIAGAPGSDAMKLPVRPPEDVAGLAATPRVASGSFRDAYLDRLLDLAGLPANPTRRLKVVGDAGNGCAGLVLERLAPRLPFEIASRQLEPDGRFPNGVPNPLLPDRRQGTADAVRKAGADMGVAWDGDFDRCFLYDARGGFIEGYYCVGMLAGEVLRSHPGGKVVHDTRVYWNTREIVLAAGGIPVMGKTGHAFMKERMRAENAVYGGEMSAHHYFREFAYCDSGMLPWLMAAGIMLRTGATLGELVEERMRAYPCSGEINRRVANAAALMESVGRRHQDGATHVDMLDGINIEHGEWRFNLRMSNTEPVLRLNVESRGDRGLMEERTGALLRQIDEEGVPVES
ncbi:MAG: phosphomannomutase [Desulfovibrio sp.]|nr:phosphomannomutase [Desulfovibrio sp.]